MSVQDLVPLVETAQAEETELIAKQGELETARQELTSAQAVVSEKQAVVTAKTEETQAEKADLIGAINSILTRCNEMLAGLQQ